MICWLGANLIERLYWLKNRREINTVGGSIPNAIVNGIFVGTKVDVLNKILIGYLVYGCILESTIYLILHSSSFERLFYDGLLSNSSNIFMNS